MRKNLLIIIFISLPFFIQAQILDHPPIETLSINPNNLKNIIYRGEKIFLFDNYIDTNKVFESPAELSDGKYIAFYFNDTTKPYLEVSYLNAKKNGTEKKYSKENKLISLTNYKNGKGDGESFTFYNDGKIYEKTVCKEGNCIYYRYEMDGSIVKSINRKKKSIIKKWNSKGKLIQKEILKNGKCIMLKSYDTYNKCWEKRKG